MITILEYCGAGPIEHYIEGRPEVPLLVGYACGCWMCADTHKVPGFCAEHGNQAVAVHEMSQEIFEQCMARSTIYREINPQFKKVGEK